MDKVVKSAEEWRLQLDPQQFQVLRMQATERPFSGRYVHSDEVGIYRCAGCGNTLFASQSKFDSHCGWPSFDDVVDTANVELVEDHSHFMKRVEVLCKRCDGHLGHLFDDGPTLSGLRYCINSAALELDPQEGDVVEK